MINPIFVFMAALLVSLAVGPKVIELLRNMKVRQTISEDAPERHMKKQGTPTMGGIIIFIGAVIGIVVVGVRTIESLAVIVMTLMFAGLGFLDDYLIAVRGKNLGLKARQKLLGQFVLAIGFIVWMHAIQHSELTNIVLWGEHIVDLGWVYYPLSVLFIVGMSNAVNLTDGLDGLASGLMGFAYLGFAGILQMTGLQGISFALAGGCLGFLWYNCNPAKVFMGDTGSLALGAAFAGIAIAGKIEVMALILGAIFIFEAISVIIQVISFKSTGKRVFKMTPIHHHFELSGWPEQKIVVRFWIIQIILLVALLYLVR